MNAQQLAEACAQEMFANDRASPKLGIAIDKVAPGLASASMDVGETMINGHSVCHGGYIFTLADTAFAFACNTRNQVTLAVAANIDFLAPAKLGDHLVADAEEISRGRKTGIYDVRVSNQEGRLVAVFRGRSRSLDQAILPINDTQ